MPNQPPYDRPAEIKLHCNDIEKEKNLPVPQGWEFLDKCDIEKIYKNCQSDPRLCCEIEERNKCIKKQNEEIKRIIEYNTSQKNLDEYAKNLAKTEQHVEEAKEKQRTEKETNIYNSVGSFFQAIPGKLVDNPVVNTTTDALKTGYGNVGSFVQAVPEKTKFIVDNPVVNTTTDALKTGYNKVGSFVQAVPKNTKFIVDNKVVNKTTDAVTSGLGYLGSYLSFNNKGGQRKTYKKNSKIKKTKNRRTKKTKNSKKRRTSKSNKKSKKSKK